VGASATLTLFDAGRHRAQSAAARAAFEETVADYRGTVLRAYQEVEDELAALRQLAVESEREDQSVRATLIVLEQAQARYKAGVATYLEVVSAENAALGARLAATDIQLRRLTASVALIKALGGGWTPGA
jgi:outer membrane protein TolC